MKNFSFWFSKSILFFIYRNCSGLRTTHRKESIVAKEEVKQQENGSIQNPRKLCTIVL